jgi:hypothetical protein
MRKTPFWGLLLKRPSKPPVPGDYSTADWVRDDFTSAASGHVAILPATGAIGPIEKELPVAESCLRVLIDSSIAWTCW